MGMRVGLGVGMLKIGWVDPCRGEGEGEVYSVLKREAEVPD